MAILCVFEKLARNAAVTGSGRGMVRRHGQRGAKAAVNQVQACIACIRLPCRSGASPSGLAADDRGAGAPDAPEVGQAAQSPAEAIRAGHARHLRSGGSEGAPGRRCALALLHDAGLRVSEAAALEWQDLECDDDGAGTVTVRSGKTGARIIAVSAHAVRVLSAIRPANAKGSVFGVSESQLRRRVKAAAKAVGAEGVTSHGDRVGMAQTMARNGAAAPAIMRQGGWQSSAMVARYTRKLAAKEAARFL